MELPKKIYFVLNPEGKAFDDSVNYRRDLCEIEFVKSWVNGWGIQPSGYEAGVLFKMFERVGFKIVEIPLPPNK